MSEKSATRGAARIFISGSSEQGFPHLEQAMEVSTVLNSMPLGNFIASSGIPTVPGLEHDERLYTQQQIITAQQKEIVAQYREIRRLRRLVGGMSQELESAASAATESEEDLELDYSAMDAQANVEIRPGVNWKAVPRTTTYSEYFDAPYELDAEER